MNRPLNVAMVAACPYPSGQGTQALVGELARGLAARGHRLHLICYAHGAFDRDEPFKVARTWAVPFYRRLRSGPDAIKPWLDALLVARCVQIIRSQDCQLVHAHNYEGALAGWLAARATARPFVYHAHNLMADELPRYFSRANSRWLAQRTGSLLDRLVPRLGQRVIALHEDLAADLRQLGVRGQRLAVIPPGIDVDFWRRPAGAPAARGKQLAYCGNLDAYQNLPLLLTAMGRVAARVPGARLVLATPNDLAAAQHLVAEQGLEQVVLVEHAPDAAATRRVLHASALAVCPRTSRSGFPIKNLNAAASGVPVVACRGGSHGVVDGVSGLVVPDDDAEALAAAIVELLQNPQKGTMLGDGGRRLAEERYALGSMVDGVEAVWRALLDERGER